MQHHRYGLGVFLVVVGGVFLSTNGIMLRNIEQADGWQILFYRGMTFAGIAIVLISVTAYGVVDVTKDRQKNCLTCPICHILHARLEAGLTQ